MVGYVSIRFLLYHHSVTNCKQSEEVVDLFTHINILHIVLLLKLSFSFVINGLLVLGVELETLSDFFDTALYHAFILIYALFYFMIIQVSISSVSNVTLLKLHFILSESASLIREYEFYLA